MIYSTTEEFLGSAPEHLLIELAGNLETNEPDTTAIERALNDASAEIDGYIGSRYPLPLSTVPDSLRRICNDIALYRLMNLRAMGDIEDARGRYKDAISFLKDIIRGEASLGLPEVSEPARSASPRFRPGSNIMKGLNY